MIDIPAADIKAKIKEQKGLSDEEIDEKIKEKLKQLAGLISEDGAAHIIANELGVEVVKQGGEAKIADLYAGMRSVTVPGKVTKKYELREFDKDGRKGKVASFLIGDETGQVRVTLWNDQTDLFAQFAEGDTVKVKNAYVKENRGYKELHLNTDSTLQLKPTDVTIGEVKTSTYEGPARTRKQIKELQGEEENVELLATIVQLYDPRFFSVDPETGKRVQEGHTGATQTNYVVNAFVDDGTGNLRTTFWKNQAQHLLGKTDEEMLQYMDNPTAFEQVKTDMLGEIVKIVGRCKKNEMFDRIELTANLVFKDVDPEEELARIQSAESKEEATAVETEPETTEAKPAETTAAGPTEATAADDAPEEAPAEPAPPMQATRARPTPGAKELGEEVEEKGEKSEEKDTDIEAGVQQDIKEEDVISLDDLEDLDEKL